MTSVVVPLRLMTTARSYVRSGGSSVAVTASVSPTPASSRSAA